MPPIAREPVTPTRTYTGDISRAGQDTQVYSERPSSQQCPERSVYASTSECVSSSLLLSVPILTCLRTFVDHQLSINGDSVPTDQFQQPSHINGHIPQPNGIAPAANALASGPVPNQAYPPSPQSPVAFTQDQISAIKVQIHAFKLISRGCPVPESIQRALHPQNGVIQDLEKLLQGPDVPSRIVDAAVKISKAGSEQPETASSGVPTTDPATADNAEVKAEEQETAIDMPAGPFLEDDVNSGIYPYNAYVNPFTHLKRPEGITPAQAAMWATRLQRLLVPSIMPAGLDPHQIISERNRFVDARIEQRIRELSIMPATVGEGGLEPDVPPDSENTDDSSKENNGMAHLRAKEPTLDSILHPSKELLLAPNAHGKLRAVIELKALRVREKQRALRAQIVERLAHGSLLPLDRKDFRRPRRPTIRDARMTESLERKQRSDRERRAKQKHLEQLAVICNHGRDMINTNRANQDRILKLGRAVQSLHAFTEKEEAKRIERISKERLKALKADDEEAYMKLIDTAKDTRITHLLRQTDAYLDSLAQAVIEQQNDDVHKDVPILNPEEGPADETMFGAQKVVDPDERTKVDYYAVAHRITEKITRQPSILVGGTLKEYQLKGLQWMVSLYNNRLNGVLADEMVRFHISADSELAKLSL